jgi:hypothetical protein
VPCGVDDPDTLFFERGLDTSLVCPRVLLDLLANGVYFGVEAR